MSLTGSRTLFRRAAEQWREIQQRFEHSGQTQVAFCAAEGLALSTFTLWRRKPGSSREMITNNDAAMFVALPDSDIPVSTSLSQDYDSGRYLWDVELQLGTDVVLRLRRGESC